MSEEVFDLTTMWDVQNMGVGKKRVTVVNPFGKDDKYTVEVVIAKIPSKPLYQDRAWLTREYVDKGRTMQEIADQFGVTPMSIHGWVKKFDIPSRPRGRRSA